MESVGTWRRAAYAFGGAAEEIARTLPIADGELVLAHGAARLKGSAIPRPAVMRLTSTRLAVLLHYAFRPDRVLELPSGAVVSVTATARRLSVVWVDPNGEHQDLDLGRWSGWRHPDDPIRDLEQLGEQFEQWRLGTP